MEITKTSNRMISISENYLRDLTNLGEKVSKQLHDLPPEDYLILINTDVSALIGHARAAKVVIEVNRIAESGAF